MFAPRALPLDAARAAAADLLLTGHLGLSAPREVVVVHTSGREAEAAALLVAAARLGLEVRPAPVRSGEDVAALRLGTRCAVRADRPPVVLFLVEDDRLPQRALAALPAGAEAVLLAGCVPGTGPLDVVARPEEVRNAELALRARLAGRSAAVVTTGADRAAGPARLDVRFGAEDVTDIDSDHHVPGHLPLRILPAGGVSRELLGADGTFVADGPVTLNRPHRLAAEPARPPFVVEVDGGRVTSLSAPDTPTGALVSRAVGRHAVDHVARLGFGVHPLARQTGADSPVNHCAPGIRLTLRAASPYAVGSADLRIDLFARGGRVETPGGSFGAGPDREGSA